MAVAPLIGIISIHHRDADVNNGETIPDVSEQIRSQSGSYDPPNEPNLNVIPNYPKQL